MSENMAKTAVVANDRDAAFNTRYATYDDICGRSTGIALAIADPKHANTNTGFLPKRSTQYPAVEFTNIDWAAHIVDTLDNAVLAFASSERANSYR